MMRRIELLAAVLADNTEHCKLCWPLGQRSTSSLGKDLWCTCWVNASVQECS